MTTLIAFALRLILLAGFVFIFVVLFEHGAANFGANAKTEWEAFTAFLKAKAEQSGQTTPDTTPAATPEPTPDITAATPPPPTPEPTPEKPKAPPSAWEELQNRKIGEGMDQPLQGLPAGTPNPKQ